MSLELDLSDLGVELLMTFSEVIDATVVVNSEKKDINP